jgi:hypothetical protein
MSNILTAEDDKEERYRIMSCISSMKDERSIYANQ